MEPLSLNDEERHPSPTAFCETENTTETEQGPPESKPEGDKLKTGETVDEIDEDDLDDFVRE